MAKWFKYLFAQDGEKTAIPDTTDPTGLVSYQQGYGADYQRVLGTDPLAKAIERNKLNQALNDITGALQQYQTHGFPDYIDATTNGGTAYAYEVGAVVRFSDGKNYQNTVASNTNAPDVSGWTLIEKLAPLASPEFTGTPTAPTATAGTNTTQLATTAFVKAKSELDSIGVNQTWQNLTTSRAFYTTYTNSTGKPIMVMVSQISTATDNNLNAYVGGIMLSNNYLSGTNGGCQIGFIVPNNTSYYMTSANGTLTKWIELR